MHQLIFTDTYIKKELYFLKKHPELIERYKKTIKLMEININHPSLRLHKLTGNLKEYHSISINLVYRIVVKLIGNKILFIYLGHHQEVYP